MTFKELKKKIFASFLHRPHTREELLTTLREAEQEHLVDHDAEGMLEGVLQVSQMQIRDIMVPRSQMTIIHEDESFDDIVLHVIENLHSRYPVMNKDRTKILGILLAKNLLQYTVEAERNKFSLHNIIQQPIIAPESQNLDKLLKTLKKQRSHMAIVIDEYGEIAGLITMEDIFEQIVGDIEDESDEDDDDDDIKEYDDYHVIKATVSIEDFDEYFESELNNEQCETIGGLVIKHLGHVPKRGEEITIAPFTFKVLHSDKRRIRLLQVSKTQ
jgi:magnesium and cobalt transporter